MDTYSMSFSKIISAQTYFLKTHLIDVEVDLSRGLHSFSIVGLADKAIEEAKERVSAAIKNSGFESPKSKNQRTTVFLAPAHLKKEGPCFDLAIALAYLLATGDIRFDSKEKLFLGELSLDGSLRPIKGALPLVLNARKLGFKEVYLPFQNSKEVSMIEGISIFGISYLREIIEHIDQKQKIRKIIEPIPSPLVHFEKNKRICDVSFEDIKGQEGAKRALEISGAGGHNIMLYGPPGTGKTMLAKAFPFILPSLSFEEALEVSSIHSFLKTSSGFISNPPFRSPHHTSSYTALVGGGSSPQPGEITFSHRGVLYMDEFPEFNIRVIEALRQPLEDQYITISRAQSSVEFPADFILIASMNPCPCGFFGSIHKKCICNQGAIQKYKNKISGPIMERIDMWVEVSEISYEKMNQKSGGDDVGEVQKRIEFVRKIQKQRFLDSKRNLCFNSRMNAREILLYCPLKDSCRVLLDAYAEKVHLSPRVYHRIIKLARTIADLDSKEDIEETHLLEAFQYRPKMG